MQISALSSIIQNFQLILNFPFNNQHDFRDRFTRQSKNQKFSGGDRILKDAKKLSTLKATKVNILPKK